ncbi:hypothetical protein CYV15_08890 [Riemerella anatipestifer]|uniref:hypothetical protein n=1 Tax=Riemerella anatipestifer TaxID=34085 RepID=UPI000D140532|nr:hypothetical protein [Riemerella anatipestifer]MDD1525537.1 hypothetical protein [Riemerella anatipestifer]PST43582.1 hypothetical protein CYV15_08890 [Riemerella anatipestifer]
MPRKLLLVLSIALLAVGCKTQKTKTDTKTESVQETKTEMVENTEQVQNQREQVQEAIKKVELFNHNFTLKSQDTTQPARLTEYREGKPFRSLEVRNAVYTEGKSVKDSIEHKRVQDFIRYISNVVNTVKEQRTQINQLKREQEHIRIEGNKLANNFKYALWLLLLIAVIWVCERTGLFRWFKSRLKKV